MDKASLRRLFLPQLEQDAVADQRIFDKLVSHPQVLAATTICSYVSYNKEPDTHRFINWCLSHQKTVCVPKLQGQSLKLYQIDSLDQCVPGFKGILEPSDTATVVDIKDVEVFVILGLAFDAAGYRLGYGKGLTDKLLQPLDAFTIGLCYTNHLVYELPHEPHDIPVSTVLTDTISLL